MPITNIADPLDVEEFEFYIRCNNGNEYIESDRKIDKESMEAVKRYRRNQDGYYIFNGFPKNITQIVKIQGSDMILYDIVK